jgi:hypothetical protein
MTLFYRCPQKRRRVHNSVIYRKISTICTPNLMAVNRLQNGLINSSIAPWASRVNCQNIFFQMGNNKTTMYHNYTLKYQKFTKKNCKKTLLSSMFHFALNIGGISAQSHMLLFVICFSSYFNLVITL